MCKLPPSDAPSRVYSVSKWPRQVHITPEALPEFQVEIDRLLKPLSKGARAALKNLQVKQVIPLKYCHRTNRASKRDQDCV